MRIRIALAVASLAALCGCSAASAPAPAEAPVAAAPVVEAPRARGPAASFESETGAMDEKAMDRAVAAFGRRSVQRCVEEGMTRLGSELGGSFKLSIRVAKDGSTRSAYLSESTLGDRATEKCVLEATGGHSWPQPVGGEGNAEKEFQFEGGAVAGDFNWTGMSRTLESLRAATAPCRAGVEGSFRATAYLGPDGKVRSAGVAPPSANGERAADCIVDAIRETRFRAPGRRGAKVTFELR